MYGVSSSWRRSRLLSMVFPKPLRFRLDARSGIIVESSEVSDEQAFWISKDIAKRIEKEVKYPGQIKVTVIREMRAVDYAK